MNKIQLSLFFIFTLYSGCSGSLAPTNIDSDRYSFIVAGHVYGAHQGKNLGLHPPFMKALREAKPLTEKFIVLAGDTVRKSDEKSWDVALRQLEFFGIPYYLVMGNHDNTDTGRKIFKKQYGDTFYHFRIGQDLFFMFDIPKGDVTITAEQIDEFEAELKKVKADGNVFVFMHEVLWNDQFPKYQAVRSNKRSRAKNLAGRTNFWSDLFKKARPREELQFYFFAGDMAGNPDSLAAFYDQLGHIHLIATGMGEVEDENYLIVSVEKGKVDVELIALNPNKALALTDFTMAKLVGDSNA